MLSSTTLVPDKLFLHHSLAAVPHCALASGIAEMPAVLTGKRQLAAAFAFLAAAALLHHPAKAVDLSLIPSCGGSTLRPNITDCSVTGTLSSNVSITANLEAPNDLTIGLTLTLTGGKGSMTVLLPGGSNVSTFNLYESSNQVQVYAFVSQAAANATGVLNITLTPSPNINVNYTFKVVTGPGNLSLVASELTALTALFTSCCGDGGGGDSSGMYTNWCRDVLPAATSVGHSPSSDLCQKPPNGCDPSGSLTALVLPGPSLQCSQFPSALAAFPNLQVLNLGPGGQRGTAPATLAAASMVLSSLSSLTHVALPKMPLSGPLTCDITVPARQYLVLSDNALTGTLPACFAALNSSLQVLYLDGNALSGPLPDFGGAPLQELVLSAQDSSALNGPLPASIADVPLLTLLLDNNTLSGEVPELPPSLITVNLSSNQFSGQLPGLPAKASVFDAGFNNLTGTLPALPSGLNALYVNNNSLTGTLPDIPQTLFLINIRANQISGSLPELPAGASMSLAYLGYNALTGTVPASWTSAAGLVWFSAAGNRLGGRLPSSYALALAFLNLEGNALTGTVPGELGNLQLLAGLRLANNSLSGSLDAFAAPLMAPRVQGGQFSASNSLVQLTLAMNQLTGSVPQQIGYMTGIAVPQTIVLPIGNSFVTLDRAMLLNNNSLSGSFPSFLLTGPVQSGLIRCGCNVDCGCVSSCACGTFFSVASQAGGALTCPPVSVLTELGLTQYQLQGLLNYYNEQGYMCSANGTTVNVGSYFMAATGMLPPSPPPPPVDNGPVSSEGSGGLSIGAIAGIVVACVLAVAVIGGAVYWFTALHYSKRGTGWHGFNDVTNAEGTVQMEMGYPSKG